MFIYAMFNRCGAKDFPKNDQNAAIYCKKAADLGDQNAMYEYAMINLEDSKFLSKNRTVAQMYLKNAAYKGHEMARKALERNIAKDPLTLLQQIPFKHLCDN